MTRPDRFLAAVQPHEDKALARIRASLTRQGRVTLHRFHQLHESSDPGDLYDPERWDAELAQDSEGWIADTLAGIGTLMGARLGVTFNVRTDRARAYITGRSTQMAGLVNGTTEEQLRQVLADAEATGAGVDVIAGRIAGFFGYPDGVPAGTEAGEAQGWLDRFEARCLTIARTETIGASNFAITEAAQQSDVATGKQWSATADGDVDAICVDLDGETVGLDEDFGDGIDQPPAHPNCRCRLLIVTPDGQVGFDTPDVEESAVTTAQLVEARPVGSVTASAGQLNIRLITPGVGSNGYYSPEVLEAAAGAQVFPAGTLLFIDHPTASEAAERPERSVKDVAAVLAEDARWDGQGLIARANPVGPWGEVVTEMAGVIGVSIRAAGQLEMGEHAGTSMPIITSLDEGRSVDFVTYAGRGGSFEVLESVRPSAVTERVMQRGLSEATANDIRDALSTVLDELYQVPEETWVWVRDYDVEAGLVYFDVSGRGDINGTYQQAYTLGSDGTAELSGERTEVTVRTTYVPVTNPAGQSTTTESQGETMPQIEEAEHRRLVEDAGRVPTLLAERDTAIQERDQARRALAEADARNAARPIVAEVFTDHQLPAATHARVTESVIAAAPLDTTGALDEAALRTAATAARTAAETEIAEALKAAGVGTVRGFGASTDTQTVTEADLDRRSANVFGRPTVKGA